MDGRCPRSRRFRTPEGVTLSHLPRTCPVLPGRRSAGGGGRPEPGLSGRGRLRAETEFPGSGGANRNPLCKYWDMLRCFIVDDSPPFLDAARGLLEREGVTVVGVASTSSEAIKRVQELQPDVTLMDIDLGLESGFEVARRLHRAAEPVPSPVIMISTHAEQDYADLIADSPAIGFLSKAALSGSAIRDLLQNSGGDERVAPAT